MPYLKASVPTTGKLLRSGKDIQFRQDTAIGGNYAVMDGTLLKFQMGGAMSGLGLEAKDVLILSYQDWSPHAPGAAANSSAQPTVAVGTSAWNPVVDLTKYPYYSQRDAKGHGEAFRMCNSSSAAMVATYLLSVTGQKNPLLDIAKRDGIGADDVFLLDYVHKHGDSTDHAAVGRALEDLGIKSTFSYNLSIDDLRKSLSLGLPMILGVLHHGSVAAPSGGGHMITAVKMKDGSNNDVICYDPFGEGFSYNNTNGKGVVYPIDPTLTARWLCGDKNGGWGRVFTRVGNVELPKVI